MRPVRRRYPRTPTRAALGVCCVRCRVLYGSRIGGWPRLISNINEPLAHFYAPERVISVPLES